MGSLAQHQQFNLSADAGKETEKRNGEKKRRRPQSAPALGHHHALASAIFWSFRMATVRRMISQLKIFLGLFWWFLHSCSWFFFFGGLSSNGITFTTTTTTTTRVNGSISSFPSWNRLISLSLNSRSIFMALAWKWRGNWFIRLPLSPLSLLSLLSGFVSVGFFCFRFSHFLADEAIICNRFRRESSAIFGRYHRRSAGAVAVSAVI